MTPKNPKLYLVNMNAYITFGEILSICFQDIGWKRTFGVNQGSLLWYKFCQIDVYQSKARYCQYDCIYEIFLSICSQDNKRNKILELIKGHNSGTNVRKMTCSNPSLDIVDMNAYIQFGEMLSFFSQYIEQKRCCCVNQGP